MDNLTIVVPYFNGQRYIEKLVGSIPDQIPVIVVDDKSDQPVNVTRQAGQLVVLPMEHKGYFAGAVNAGIAACSTDVLILNQDTYLTGDHWLDVIADNRRRFAMIGERITGDHPAFPDGYIHGTFMFLRRDLIDRVGLLNAKDFPLWGSTAEYQWRAARAGFRVLPLVTVPGFVHERGQQENYGSSIKQLLGRESRRDLLIRTPPLISVVVPVYNQGRYLADLLGSLIGGQTSLGYHPGQTLQAFEVILVNDGSTDNSLEIARSLADPWQGIKVIDRQNGGAAAAQNTGIGAAVGRYITVIDGDDMRTAGSLELLYRTAVANPGKVPYDDIRVFADGALGKVWAMPSTYDFDILATKNQMHKGIMFPRQAWAEVGGYPEVMQYGREDWAFNVALGRAGFCGIHVDGPPGYLYRREGQNRTLKNTTIGWRQFFRRQLEQLFPDVYNGGKRPMACCGKSTNPTPQNGNGGGTRSMPKSSSRSAPAAGPGSMVLLDYIGPNAGTITWGGPGSTPSKRRYTFGGTPRHRTKYVDQVDVAYFLNLRENGAKAFARHPVEDVADERPVEDLAHVPNPGDLTVEEIQNLELSTDGWRELLDREKEGKNRKTAVALIHDRIGS